MINVQVTKYEVFLYILSQSPYSLKGWCGRVRKAIALNTVYVGFKFQRNKNIFKNHFEYFSATWSCFKFLDCGSHLPTKRGQKLKMTPSLIYSLRKIYYKLFISIKTKHTVVQLANLSCCLANFFRSSCY